MDGAARVRVGSIAAHGKVLTWFHKSRVREEGVDDAAEHDGAGRVGYEVSFILLFVFGAEAFDFGLC